MSFRRRLFPSDAVSLRSQTLVPTMLIAVAMLLSSCGAPVREPMQLTILHTNDIHGKFRDQPATWREGNPPIGGFANLSAYVNEERAKGNRLLLLDGGDLMTGNPICNIEYQGVSGGAMIAFMNWMGYDAMALGNHEFDRGLETLDALLSLAEFPVLSANIYRPQGGLTAPKAYTILTVDGLRIGVIGLLTDNLYGVASAASLAGTRVESGVVAAQKLVNKIDGETDLIILLSHSGVAADRNLARQVEGVDIIVGGHSHTRLPKGTRENGVLIVQAGSHNRNMGHVEVTVAGDTLSASEAKLIDLWPREGGDANIINEVLRYSELIDHEYGQVIGSLASPWSRSPAGSNVGDWIADQFRLHANVDFGLMNSGGIRKSMDAGPITKLDIMEMMPFANVLMTFQCTGAQLLVFMHRNASAMSNGGRGMLFFSGMRFTYVVADDGSVEIINAEIGGRAIDPEAIYTGASSDFIVRGDLERHFGSEPTNKLIEGSIDSDILIQAIERAPGPIDARLDGRMMQLPEKPAAAEAVR